MAKEVYIVHCIDTEGPLNETLSATFERIKDIFNVEIPASKENLEKLQKKEFNLGGKEDAIANLVAPKRLAMNKTWTEIEAMLSRIQTSDFRNEILDSSGNGWLYNWFCMDHVGFSGYNPRHRDAGYHNIYDFYKFASENYPQDDIQFHYHPVSMSGDFNIAGVTYLNSSNIYDILSRKIIDRGWFPCSFRPGFHAERPDSNWFLEQWIPFDYANQSKKGENSDQPDLSDGRFGFWDKATKEWEVYHPSIYDYQVKGCCNRYIARCLNMEARLRELTLLDVEEGFERANEGKTTIISFCDHDFRDIEPEVNKVRNMIYATSQKFKDVKFYYSTSANAIRKSCDIQIEKPNLKAVFSYENDDKAVLTITSDNIFGVQPFLAIKTLGGNYYWEDLDFTINPNVWKFTFDSNTFKPRVLDTVGIASNSKSGVTEVIRIDVQNNTQVKSIFNLK